MCVGGVCERHIHIFMGLPSRDATFMSECLWIQGRKGSLFHFWGENFLCVSLWYFVVVETFPCGFWIVQCNMFFIDLPNVFRQNENQQKVYRNAENTLGVSKIFRIWALLMKAKELKDWAHKAAAKMVLDCLFPVAQDTHMLRTHAWDAFFCQWECDLVYPTFQEDSLPTLLGCVAHRLFCSSWLILHRAKLGKKWMSM